MAISLIQTDSSLGFSATTAARTVTLSSPAQSGNLIVVGIYSDAQGSQSLSLAVTDDQGNTYNQAVINTPTGFQRYASIWYAKNITGGSVTVSVVPTYTSSSKTFGVIIREYAGLDTSSPLDKAAAAGNTSSTALNSGNTATTTQANELLVAVGGDTGVDTYTAGAGFVNLIRIAGTFSTSSVMADKIVAATGTYAATFTASLANDNACAVATFKEATGGGLTNGFKVYNGSTWEVKPVKVWTGSAWVTKPLKRWNGSSWVAVEY